TTSVCRTCVGPEQVTQIGLRAQVERTGAAKPGCVVDGVSPVGLALIPVPPLSFAGRWLPCSPRIGQPCLQCSHLSVSAAADRMIATLKLLCRLDSRSVRVVCEHRHCSWPLEAAHVPTRPRRGGRPQLTVRYPGVADGIRPSRRLD